MGFTLLNEIVVFLDNKENFTNKQRKNIIKYYRKKLTEKKLERKKLENYAEKHRNKNILKELRNNF
jgi:hypothetical protein